MWPTNEIYLNIGLYGAVIIFIGLIWSKIKNEKVTKWTNEKDLEWREQRERISQQFDYLTEQIAIFSPVSGHYTCSRCHHQTKRLCKFCVRCGLRF